MSHLDILDSIRNLEVDFSSDLLLNEPFGCVRVVREFLELFLRDAGLDDAHSALDLVLLLVAELDLLLEVSLDGGLEFEREGEVHVLHLSTCWVVSLLELLLALLDLHLHLLQIRVDHLLHRTYVLDDL